MFLFALLSGCLDAAAESPVTWDYLRVEIAASDCLVIETADGPIPADRAVVLKTRCEKLSDGQPLPIKSAAGALDYLGALGWELVAVQANDFYFKRRK